MNAHIDFDAGWQWDAWFDGTGLFVEVLTKCCNLDLSLEEKNAVEHTVIRHDLDLSPKVK